MFMQSDTDLMPHLMASREEGSAIRSLCLDLFFIIWFFLLWGYRKSFRLQTNFHEKENVFSHHVRQSVKTLGIPQSAWHKSQNFVLQALSISPAVDGGKSQRKLEKILLVSDQCLVNLKLSFAANICNFDLEFGWWREFWTNMIRQ